MCEEFVGQRESWLRAMFVPHKILATGSASQGGVGGGSGGGLEAAGAMDNLSINKEYYGDPAAGNYSDVSLKI